MCGVILYMSYIETGQPTPDSENVTYCDIDDVKRYLQAYGFESTDMINETMVNVLIEQVTEDIESEIETAFRALRIEGISADAYPTKEQRQANLTRRNSAKHNSHGHSNSSFSPNKWVQIQLPHTFIENVESITAITGAGDNLISDKELWSLNKRSGSLRVDYRAFQNIISGKAGQNLLEDARVTLTYTYNYGRIRKEIQRACAKLVVYEIVTSDAYADVLPDEVDTVEPDEMSERFKNDAEETIDKFK